MLVEETSLVNTIRNDYLSLYSDKDASNNVTNEIIQTAENIISSVPKEKRPKMLFANKALFKRIDNDYLQTEKFIGGMYAITSNLKGWSKDVFLSVNELDEDVFDLKRVYELEDRLQRLHPSNKHVKPKIRQQLQYLRNHGLLEFLGDGKYKKLWSKHE